MTLSDELRPGSVGARGSTWVIVVLLCAVRSVMWVVVGVERQRAGKGKGRTGVLDSRHGHGGEIGEEKWSDSSKVPQLQTRENGNHRESRMPLFLPHGVRTRSDQLDDYYYYYCICNNNKCSFCVCPAPCRVPRALTVCL